MHGIMAALLGGTLGALGLMMGPGQAPDRQAQIKACQAKCDASESETDRATCRLNCRHAVEEKDRAHIIRWTEERSVGGRVPGQGAAPPPKRTVTKVTPSGTVTETTTTAPSGKAQGSAQPRQAVGRDTTALPSPRHRYYFGLVDCQDRCNTHKMGGERARCKLRCFRQHPGPPPARTTNYAPKKSTGKAAAASPPPQPKAQPKVAPKPTISGEEAWAACQQQCSSEGSEDERATCEAQCWDRAKRKAGSTP